MALTLRIPEELDRQLEALAAERHISKHALLLQGAGLIVERYSRRGEIDAGLDFVLSHDADLLKRLEDS
jgi:predicted transcriptional regulator